MLWKRSGTFNGVRGVHPNVQSCEAAGGSRRENVSWAQRGTRRDEAERLRGGFVIAQAGELVDPIADMVVSTRALSLGAGLRVDASTVQDTTTVRALDIVRHEGQAQPHIEGIHEDINIESGPMHRMKPISPRVVGRWIPQFPHPPDAWPILVTTKCSIELLQSCLSEQSR